MKTPKPGSLADLRVRVERLEALVEGFVEEDDECKHTSFSAEGDCHGCGYSYQECYPQPPIVVGDRVYMPPNVNPKGTVTEINAHRFCLVVWGDDLSGRPNAHPMWLLAKVDSYRSKE